MSSFKDSLEYIKGHFYIEAKDLGGDVLWTVNENNLVVTSGREALAMLLAAANGDKQVTQISFANEYGSEDKTITGFTQSYVKNIDGFEFPENTAVKFNWSLGYSEFNTNDITNYGLFTVDSTLFAMKVRPKITKDEYMSLNGSWTILL